MCLAFEPKHIDCVDLKRDIHFQTFQRVFQDRCALFKKMLEKLFLRQYVHFVWNLQAVSDQCGEGGKELGCQRFLMYVFLVSSRSLCVSSMSMNVLVYVAWATWHQINVGRGEKNWVASLF